MLLLFSLVISSFAFAQDIQISVDGKKHSTLSLEQIRKMKVETIEFFNFVTKRAELYRGTPALQMIEKIVPDQTVVEVELVCEDNYRAFVSLEMLNRTNSIFAYERADGDTFTRFSQKKKMLVPLAPLYHVWDLKPIPKDERLYYSSAYQIKEINVITNKVNFGVNENAVDQSIYLGYQTYKRNCIMCHALGKTGGDIGVDLVKRKVVDTKGADYVKKYVLDPQSVNPKTHMLPLAKFNNRDEMAQGIVDFLKFMQNPDEILAKKKGSERESSYQALQQIVKEAK